MPICKSSPNRATPTSPAALTWRSTCASEPQADGDFAVHVVEISSGPKVLQQTGIRYPTQALMARSEGAVLVHMTVNPDGSVGNVRGEMAGRSHKSLIRAAERAVEGWRFEPDQVNGVPIATDTVTTIRFCMELHRQPCSERWAADKAEHDRYLRERGGAPVYSGRVPTADVAAQRIDSSDGGGRSRARSRGNVRIKGR